MTPTKSVSAFFFPEKQQTINLSKSPSTSSVNNISRHALKLMKKYFSKNELLNSTITGKQNHGTLDPDIIKRIKDMTMSDLGVSEIDWDGSLKVLSRRHLEYRKFLKKKNNDKQ